jgi:hypothetical protein
VRAPTATTTAPTAAPVAPAAPAPAPMPEGEIELDWDVDTTRYSPPLLSDLDDPRIVLIDPEDDWRSLVRRRCRLSVPVPCRADPRDTTARRFLRAHTSWPSGRKWWRTSCRRRSSRPR